MLKIDENTNKDLEFIIELNSILKFIKLKAEIKS
jgi:hypothetical protein